MGGESYSSILTKKPLFVAEIKDNMAECYTLHNLSPATAYKAQLTLFQLDLTAPMA